MDWVSVSARLLLAAVFAIAAAAKLLDQAGVRETLRAFRVPPRLIGGAALALPVAEAAVSVALLVAPTARLGGLAGVALIAVFSVGIASVLRRGEQPECHCFGQAASTPVGPGTLVRNAALAALGAAAATATAPNLVTWSGERSAAELSALALGGTSIAFGALAVGSLSAQRSLNRQVEQLRRMTMPGLDPGTPAPDIRLTDMVLGGERSTSELLGDGRAILVFVSSDCEACQELMPIVGRWQRSLAEQLQILAIGSGDPAEYRRMAQRHGLAQVLLEDGDVARRAFGVVATPSAVAVGPGAVIDGPTAEGLPAVESLVRQTLGRSATANGH